MNRLTAAAPLVLLMAGQLAFGQVDRTRTIKTPAGDAGGVQRASCVLQLDYDVNRNGSRNLDVQTLNAILTSTAILDPAAKKALNLDPTEWPKVAQVELLSAGQTAVRVGVTITSDAKLPPTAAQTFLEALTASARVAVEQAGKRSETILAKRIAQLENEVVVAQKHYDDVSAALAAAPRPGGFGMTDSDPRFIARNAAMEKANLQLTLAGNQARLRVLDEELPTLRPTTQPAKTKVENDVEVTTAPLAGALSTYDRFVGERISLRLNVAESEARLKILDQRLMVNASDAPTSAPAPGDYERLNMDTMNARQALQQAQSDLSQARRDSQNTGTGPLRLLVLDGRANAE